ncbi:MAG: type II secretion system protein [Chthoniobacterales bacterium]
MKLPNKAFTVPVLDARREVSCIDGIQRSLLTSRSRKAFTLIELLVVIVIMLVLAALLIPGYRKAIDQANETGCVSNVHTMTKAALSWISDYGPFARSGLASGYDTKTGASINWNAELIPAYLPHELRCPGKPKSYNGYYGWRYAVNDMALSFGSYVPSPAPTSRVVLTAEMYYMPDGWWSGSHLTSTSLGWNTGGIPQSHFGGLNLGMADGHVALVKAPYDSTGTINWWAGPAAAHDLITGYYYDTTYWAYILIYNEKSWN